MSDQGRPEHPAPWRWERDEAYRPPLAASRLVDANGATLLEANTDEDVEASSPVVRELIRLAPELEATLRRLEWSADDPFSNRQHACPECSVVEAPHLATCSIGTILAALDAARAATLLAELRMPADG